MPVHRRKAIRDAVAAGLTAAPEILALVPAPAVEASRSIALDPAALPRVLVYLRGETVEGFLLTVPREYRIRSELVVEYVAAWSSIAGGPGEDELDEVALALEAALDRLETDNLSDLVREMTYAGTDVQVSEGTERGTISLSMRYQLELGRVVGDGALDDFVTAAIEHAVGDATADNATDVVTLPIV